MPDTATVGDMALYVDVLNKSTVVDGATIATYCAAIQKQVRNDYAPIWLGGYDIHVALKTAPVASTHTSRHITVAVLDDSDQAGALGYHDTDEHGNPLGKVFAKTDQRYGLAVSVTMSHEILEILGDPFTLDGIQTSPSVWAAREVGDPCEADEFGYTIDGVLVSDFVLPSYFVRGSAGPYDFRNHLKAPMTLLRGGYISLWSQSTGWTQQQAESAPGVASRAQTMHGGRHLQRALTALGMAMLPVQAD